MVHNHNLIQLLTGLYDHHLTGLPESSLRCWTLGNRAIAGLFETFSCLGPRSVPGSDNCSECLLIGTSI